MKKNSSVYIIVYTVIITIVAGSLLGAGSLGLKSFKEANIELDRQKSILATVMDLPKDPKQVVDIYSKRVKGYVVNSIGEKVEGIKAANVKVDEEYTRKLQSPGTRLLPVYEISGDDGKVESYVFPLYGFGLWDVIWGYIALDAQDMNTVKGVVLAQKGETSGLGARISDDEIHQRYKGKKIFDPDNTLKTVQIQKGEHGGGEASIETYKGKEHQIDGMSGATITGRGVNEMFRDYLGLYERFIKSKKNN